MAMRADAALGPHRIAKLWLNTGRGTLGWTLGLSVRRARHCARLPPRIAPFFPSCRWPWPRPMVRVHSLRD